jgi:hypothetical protein
MTKRKKAKSVPHDCSKVDIDWASNPSLGDGGIHWNGVCRSCKRKVFEVYEQTDELYDRKKYEDDGCNYVSVYLAAKREAI